MEYVLTNARKSLNVLKILCKQPWGQDTTTLIHLWTSLVRSKFSYAQEVFFSAPTYWLTKLRSVDCRAYQLALGVSIHASCMGTYREVGLLPLDEFRQLASAKYILRSSTIRNSNYIEGSLKSDADFPKKAKTISPLTSINSYTSDLCNVPGVTPKETATRPSASPLPIWDLNKAKVYCCRLCA